MLARPPRVQTDNREVNQLQNGINTQLNTLTANPFVNGIILTQIVLVTGSVNTVTHRLGRILTGWIPIRTRANAVIWDSQDSNNRAQSTLLLNTSANITIDLYVF